MDAPCADHQGGQQHEEAVGDRPADEARDHGLLPEAAASGAKGVTVVSCGRSSLPMKNSNVTRSPTRTLRGAPVGGSLKSIVIGPHLIVGMGPCDKVIASLPMASTLASPTWRGAAA